MEIQWWNWDFDKIQANISFLLNADIEKMIEVLKNKRHD
jgi:hypothetical protein